MKKGSVPLYVTDCNWQTVKRAFGYGLVWQVSNYNLPRQLDVGCHLLGRAAPSKFKPGEYHAKDSVASADASARGLFR